MCYDCGTQPTWWFTKYITGNLSYCKRCCGKNGYYATMFTNEIDPDEVLEACQGNEPHAHKVTEALRSGQFKEVLRLMKDIPHAVLP